MEKNSYKVISGIFCFLFLLLLALPAVLLATPQEVPVKGMVTMVDLGAGACVPCKMMAPILVKMEKQYAGKAAVVFLDVWKDQAQAKRFGIQAIPTQIFFDKAGKEVFRHVGFLSEKDIVSRFKALGVELEE